MNTSKIYLLLAAISLAFISCEKPAEIALDPIANPGDTMGTNTQPKDTTMASTGNPGLSKDFTLTSDTNLKVSLSDFKDNVVVLFFFGSGCPSCKAVSPNIQKTFVDDYANKKVQVIGLDTWDGNLNAVKSFRSNANLTFPLLLQASGVAKTFETTYDRILVVDKKGEVRFKGTQLARNDIANAKKAVDEYLAK